MCSSDLGAIAVLKQYLFNRYPSMSRQEVSELALHRLLSTAQPLVNPRAETFYSPRQQGAGLADIAAALAADTVLYNRQSGRAKIELGDNQTFALTLPFTIDNRGGTDRSYAVSVTVLHDSPKDAGFNIRSADTVAMQPHSVLVNGAVGGSAVAAPNETADVVVAVNLYRAEIDRLLESFPNGTYVEGFLSLAPDDGSPTLGLPFLGFWGDWGRAPVMEPYDVYTQDRIDGVYPYFSGNRLSSTFFEEEYNRVLATGYSIGLDTLGAYGIYSSPVPLGYDSRFNAISPGGDMAYNFCAPTLNLLRAGSSGHYIVRDASGQEVWRSPDIGERYKYYDEQLADKKELRWYGTDQSGRRLPDGAYTIEVTVVGAVSGRTEHWQAPVRIDSRPPVLGGISYDAATGLLDVKAGDNNHVQAVFLLVSGSDGRDQVYDVREFYTGDTSNVTAQFFIPGIRIRDPYARTVAVVAIDYAGNEVSSVFDFNRYNIPVIDLRENGQTVSEKTVDALRGGIQSHGTLFLTAPEHQGSHTVEIERGAMQILADSGAKLEIYAEDSTLLLTAEQIKTLAASGHTLTFAFTVGTDSDWRTTARLAVSANGEAMEGTALLAFDYRAYDREEIYAVFDDSPFIDSLHDGLDSMYIKANFNRPYTLEISDFTYDDLSFLHAPKAIAFLTARGIVEGDGKGRFLPENTVTRAEFVKMMAGIAGADLSAYTQHSPYQDVRAGSWYTPYVAWATDVGLARGIGNNLFNPHGQITFEEMALFTARFTEFRGNALPQADHDTIFVDQDTIRSWAKNEAAALLKAGILHGDARGNLNPRQPVLRFETAQILFDTVVFGIFAGNE